MYDSEVLQPVSSRAREMGIDELVGNATLSELLAHAERSVAFADTLLRVGLRHARVAYQFARDEVRKQGRHLVLVKAPHAQLARKLVPAVLARGQ